MKTKNCAVCRKTIIQTLGKKIFCESCAQERDLRKQRLGMRRKRNNPKLRRMLLDRVNESARKLRLEVLTHYSKGRLRCGCPGCRTVFVGFLQIDHVKGDGHKHLGKNGRRITSSGLMQYLKKNNFPSGYQVLCGNCNGPGGKNTGKRCPMHGKVH